MPIEASMSINAITLTTARMGQSIRFYEALGFHVGYGDDTSDFVTMAFGNDRSCFVNLIAVPTDADVSTGWGRVIFHVEDVDALYARAVANGLSPRAEPRDASWGERMFPMYDPNGHDLSFAKPLY
jgi:catechol 2,3-dioxygenase-like lactoylglutathione lyase family enzyme